MESAVYVEPSTVLRGALRYQSLHPDFQSQPFITEYDTLTHPERIVDLERFVEENGLRFVFVGDAAERYGLLRRVATERFTCSSPFLKDNELFRFQNAGAMLAYLVGNVLIQWDTGCGKTVCATLVLQRWFDEGLIDVGLVFCTKPMLVDWSRFLSRWTSLQVVPVSGTRQHRHRAYGSGADIYVLNYEKARLPKGGRKGDWSKTDLEALLGLVEGRRAALVLDEAHVVGNTSTQAHKGLQRLIEASSEAKVVALTATSYTSSPLTVYGVMRLIDASLVEKTKAGFVKEYAKGFTLWGEPVFDRNRLALLGERLKTKAHITSKAEPEIAEQFPAMTEREVFLELSDEDRKVYEYIRSLAWDSWGSSDYTTKLSLFGLLRLVCDTSEALARSSSAIAAEARERYRCRAEDSAKFAAVTDLIREVIGSGDKVVVFSYWANAVIPILARVLQENIDNLSLVCYDCHDIDKHLILGVEGGDSRGWVEEIYPENPRSETPRSPRPGFPRGFRRRGLESRPPEGGGFLRGIDLSAPLFIYTGNLSNDARAAVVDRFNSHDGPAVLLASDAGKYGLNIYAPYVIHVDMPYTAAALKQRRDRIHRIDSIAHGVTRCWSYTFTTMGTVEERVRELVERRQIEALVISDGVSAIGDGLSNDDLEYVMFG